MKIRFKMCFVKFRKKIIIIYRNLRKKLYKTNWKKVIKIISIASLSLIFILFISFLIYFKTLEKNLPDPQTLKTRSSEQTTIIYDRNGNELYRFFDEKNRSFISIEDVPEHLKWSILAAEDIDFYEHAGLDIPGILRCSYQSTLYIITGGRGGQFCGASTITQQLVRNTLLYDTYGEEAFERQNKLIAIRRKFREIMLTYKIEQVMTKDEILQMYINEVPLGGVNYGFQAASQSFFGKSVSDLDLHESALLAGFLKAPAQYNPLFGADINLSKNRQEYVFSQLEKYQNKTGISNDEILAAREKELRFRDYQFDIYAPHFVFDVYYDLLNEYDEDTVRNSGFKITTTIDLETQQLVEEKINTQMPIYKEKYGAENTSVIVLDPQTNQILALVGSANYWESDNPKLNGNVNVANSPRQMASSVKPYTYLTAIENGYGIWLETPDIPMDFGYDVRNLSGTLSGTMTAREALVKSLNIPAMYTIDFVGTDGFKSTAEKMGITTIGGVQPDELHITLGTREMTLLEHTSAYTIFATGGIKRPPTKVLKIEDSSGALLYEYQPTDGERIFPEQSVYQINWALCDLGNFGDQIFADEGYFNINGERALCGKTGTSDGPRDTIAMLYNKNLVIGTWIGNSDSSVMIGALSGNTALPLGHSIAESLAEKYPSELFDEPEGIVHTQVCKETGGIPAFTYPSCTYEKTIYYQNHPPRVDTRQYLTLCKSNGLLPYGDMTQGLALGLYEQKILIHNDIEFAKRNAEYEAYLQSRGFVTNLPGKGECPPTSGITLPPSSIQIVSPQSGTIYSYGETMYVDVQFFNPSDFLVGNQIYYDEIRYYLNGQLRTTFSGGNIPSQGNSLSFFFNEDYAPGNYTLRVEVDERGKTTLMDQVSFTIAE